MAPDTAAPIEHLPYVLLWLAFGKILLGLAWEWLMATPGMREHRVYRIETPPTQRLRELKSSWHVVSDAIFLYALVELNLIRFAPDTLANTLITFGIFYVWVEVWYYSTHRLAHQYDFLYKFHKSHHLTLVVTPLSSISMSWVEKWIFYTTGWLGFMAAASWFAPVSLYGIAAYYTYHFIISLHGHSNVEAARFNAVLTRLGMGSATSHALHHTRFRVNYGFSNMLLDRLLGTYAKETGELQARAIEKRGVTSLKPRSAS